MLRRELFKTASSFAAGRSLYGLWTLPNDIGLKQAKIAQTTYDVVVYGGTVAGINAAYVAGLQGMNVALLEPTNYLGGITGPGALVNIDQLLEYGNLIGGTWWQEYQWMASLAGQAYNPSWPTTTAPSNSSSDATYTSVNSHRPTPLIAMKVLKYFAYLSSKVDVFYNCALGTFGGSVYPAVTMNPTTKKITSLSTTQGIVRGLVFIDASYEGDVLAAVAKQYGLASYTIGRESSAAYGESHAGRQMGSDLTVSGVSFTSGGLPRSRFSFDPGGSTGDGDAKVQPINYRVPYCLASNGGVAWTQPAGYDATQYTVYGDIATSAGYTTLSQCIAQDFLFGGTASTKLSNDGGGSIPFIMYANGDEWPDATPTVRASIVANIKQWYQGLFYAIANDTSFPSAVRTNAQTFGYDPYQFQNNGYMPYQAYIREGRRMVGSHVIIESETLNGATVTNPIGYGTYNFDIHAIRAYTSANGSTINLDGSFNIQSDTYGNCQIPMEALIPAAGQCKNLIVPVCISATHCAWAALRLEPQFAIMGDAAGLMAYRVAAGLDSDVQSITYASLATLLTSINAKYS